VVMRIDRTALRQLRHADTSALPLPTAEDGVG
jgi:hypothetical protein